MYDDIHGEGAYDDLYYVSPIYGSDYESEYDNDNEIDDDYETELYVNNDSEQ